MQQDIPEERLLNLIKKKVSAPKAAVEQSPKNKPQNPFYSELKQVNAKNKFFRLPAFSSTKYLQIVFNVFGLIILVLLVDSLFFEVPRKEAALKRQVAAVNQPAHNLAGQKTAATTDGDYSVFAERFRARPLFSAQSLPAEAGVELSTTGSVFSKFALVGILMGADKQAIIKDTESQKTYYLMEGQSLDGVFVEEIREGKVVLSFEGEKFVLVL
jgi:type II secretory pathway component PulC